MTIADILMILAVITGPILAVQVQKLIESWRSKRERKFIIFRVLMATRGTPVSPQHVEALNLIDIEFSGNNTKKDQYVTLGKFTLIILVSVQMITMTPIIR